MADKGTTMVKHAARRIQRMGNEHIQQETEGKKLSKKEYSTSRGQSIQRDEETKKKATSAGLEESTLLWGGGSWKQPQCQKMAARGTQIDGNRNGN